MQKNCLYVLFQAEMNKDAAVCGLSITSLKSEVNCIINIMINIIIIIILVISYTILHVSLFELLTFLYIILLLQYNHAAYNLLKGMYYVFDTIIKHIFAKKRYILLVSLFFLFLME